MADPSEAVDAPLTLTLFGSFEARLRGEPLPPPPRRKVYWLLVLLVLRSGAVARRDLLAGFLWPEAPGDAALGNLRNCLTHLRRSLGPEAHRLQAPTPRSLAFDLAGVAVDLVAFDAAIARGDRDDMEHAVALYRGPLLEGCVEEWVIPERQQREQVFLAALESLAQTALAEDDPAAAERYFRRAICADPLRETAHRSLMRLLAESGNLTAANQVYFDLRRHLRDECNSEPDPETTATFQRLRDGARQNAARRGREVATEDTENTERQTAPRVISADGGSPPSPPIMGGA